MTTSRADGFRWIVGIENAFIPDMGVDELSWTGHRERWREDLLLAREVGADTIRYGLTWPELEPERGRYDWRLCDEVVAELERLELEPIWDLVHFGTPTYLQDGFLDPDYVEAVAAFAGAFARRYRGRVNRITPLNEPFISTSFRAGLGIWPPHLKGREGFVRMLHPIVEGVRASIRAIRTANPEAEIWLNDGADTFHATEPDLADEAARRTAERYAPFDLLLGSGHAGRESFAWLREAGYPHAGLEAEPVVIDVIGLDYYPETEHDLYRDDEGRVQQRTAARPHGVLTALRDYHARYRLPLFIAESSHGGSDADRAAWIDGNLAAIRRARAEGIAVVGYTWWPLFDHIDWNSLLTRRDGFVCPAGLYHLQPTVHDRRPTPAVEAFRAAVGKGI